MCKKFASQTALDNIRLEVQPGEFFSLLGPSGCGKSTLLRIIAGFETPTSGELSWNEMRIEHILPQDRPFNMIFQKYALFPHLNVFENVAFGLRVKKVKEEHLERRVSDALATVGLSDFKHRFPETLSGGQAQRVAVARAIVNEPKILLLDEPLSALDQKMREHMQTELRLLQRRLGITFILVTHDQEEALALSDRVAVMNHGRVEQISTPQELYDRPQSHFVAQFVGSMGSVKGKARQENGTLSLLASATVLGGRGAAENQSDVEAFVRPDRVRLFAPGADAQGFENRVPTTISGVAFKGGHFEVVMESGTHRLKAWLKPEDLTSTIVTGQNVLAAFRPEDTFIFERPHA